MEIGKKDRKNEDKLYIEVVNFTQTQDQGQTNIHQSKLYIGKKIQLSPTFQQEEVENESSVQSIRTLMNPSLVTQRRFRKKNTLKSSIQRQVLMNSHSKQANQAPRVRKVVKKTNLIKRLIQKMTLNSIFRKPVQYDPFQNQFNLKNKIIYGIEKKQIPKYVQNIILVCRIIYVLIYIFVIPLTLIFEEIDQCELNVSLKILGICFCFLDILQIYNDHSALDHTQQKISFKKIQFMKRIGISTQIGIIFIIILSITLTELHFSIGSLFFLAVSINIKSYLSQIVKLENRFFTATHHQKYWNLFKVLSLNLIVCHILACILIGVASIRPQDSWMVINHINLTPWFEQYIWSYYFGTTIILTIGFGDLHPGNYIQAFFIIIISFCACVFFGYNINYIGNLINLIKQDEVEKNNKLKVFNSLAKRTAVSSTTLAEITNYIVQSSKIKKESNYTQEKELIQELPEGLRSSFLAQTNLKLFNHLKKIISFTNKSIEKLSLKIEAKICHPNQILKNKGHLPSLMILQSGEIGFVAHLRGSRLHNLVIQRISNTIQQQSKLICVDILQKQPLKYYIKSLAYSIVYQLDQNTFEDCIKQSKEDYQTYRQVLDRCRYKLNEFGLVKCQFCENKYHTLFECPRLHFCPFKKTVPFKYNHLRGMEKQQRVKFIRKKQSINFYDYFSSLLYELNVNSSCQSAPELKGNPVPRRKKECGSMVNNKWLCNQQKNRESFRMTLDMVTQIREDIMKLKVDNSHFQFNLWDCTDCDEISNFKYYFPKYNSSSFDQRLVKHTLLTISKNFKRKPIKKVTTFN